jgi:hypothetical protein
VQLAASAANPVELIDQDIPIPFAIIEVKKQMVMARAS